MLLWLVIPDDTRATKRYNCFGNKYDNWFENVSYEALVEYVDCVGLAELHKAG